VVSIFFISNVTSSNPLFFKKKKKFRNVKLIQSDLSEHGPTQLPPLEEDYQPKISNWAKNGGLNVPQTWFGPKTDREGNQPDNFKH
jgi:hypothetical protein